MGNHLACALSIGVHEKRGEASAGAQRHVLRMTAVSRENAALTGSRAVRPIM